MEPRLIDANAFNTKLQDNYHGAVSDSYLYIYQILRLIDDAPTVEAAPVVHSGWKASGSGWMCESCGYQTDESTAYMLLHKYCPDCGSKMDL